MLSYTRPSTKELLNISLLNKSIVTEVFCAAEGKEAMGVLCLWHRENTGLATVEAGVLNSGEQDLDR